MLETPDELAALQRLLEESNDAAGPHMAEIITPERRLNAEEICARLQGMRLLAVATTTADGRPLVGPVDGYFLHGSFYFSAGRESVKMRHLAVRSPVSAMHLPGEELSVVVHGTAELFDIHDRVGDELRQAMLDHYLPTSGAAFETWLNDTDALGARIEASRMFTFHMVEAGT
jgi:nitroimidazol reductase NimA-like FMN-containing flavoprotein (pyridoxamine 5'-phosphate oxidase superfamily)